MSVIRLAPQTFLECLLFVASQHGDSFQVEKENLERLYDYRNDIAHFYSEKLDIIAFALLKRSVQLYQHFLLKYFAVDLAAESDLVLLPIGFKKPYSPFDFISNQTAVKELPIEARRFIQNIIESTQRLDKQGIEEPILVDFKVNLINEKRTKNADIIAGITNKIDTDANIAIESRNNTIHVTDDPSAPKVILTRDKNVTSGTFLHEQLSKELFNGINNVVDTNNLLAQGRQRFVFDKSIYYRIYAERDYVSYNIKNIELLAQTGLDFYTPYLFWFAMLPSKSCANIIHNIIRTEKYLQMLSLIRLVTLLGASTCQWLFNKLHVKYGNHSQPPEHYRILKKRVNNSWNKDVRLIATKRTAVSTLILPDEPNPVSLDYLMKNRKIASNALSKACLSMFEGNCNRGANCRDFDVLAYGKEIQNKSSEIESELKVSK